MVLLSALPHDALFRLELEAARQKALKPTVEQIRDRAKHYQRQREQAAAMTAEG